MEKTCKNCGTPITKEYCEDNYPKVCEHWAPKNPNTNADRIRAMSDEELAKVPAKFGYSCVFPQKECSESDTCEKCLIEWLKQPAEEKYG